MSFKVTRNRYPVNIHVMTSDAKYRARADSGWRRRTT